MPVHTSEYQRVLQEAKKANAQLVVVTKTRPLADLEELYALGHRDFGENRVQELLPKYEALPKDIRWHLIGTLQSNKLKYIAPFIHLIHSLDRLSLLKELNKEGKKIGRVIPCLMQFYLAQEESKQGLDWEEAQELLEAIEAGKYPHISLEGLMTMASFSQDQALVRSEFLQLGEYFSRIQESYQLPALRQRSMGMSGDYALALQAGSTMLRVGSLLFCEKEPES